MCTPRKQGNKMLRKGSQCFIFAVLILRTLSVTSVECYNVKEKSPATNLITSFVQSFIQSLRLSDNTPSQRSFAESPVRKAIRQLISELKPYLQDEDVDPAIQGNDDTTIIEFEPKRSFLRERKEPSELLQTNIRKYEEIKSDIKAALEKEAVSDNTKKMVTSTLDDLIAQVIGNQCTWKSVEHSPAVFRNGRDAKHNITVEEWEELKTEYMKFLEGKHMNKSMVLFNEFHNFFSKVINDTQFLSNKYKIKCKLININDTEDTKLRQGKQDDDPQDSCYEFKICTGEMREFLLEFYKSLNDTAVSVFVNYAAMYSRDVINDDESQEKDSVPNVLKNLPHAVNRRVTKVFLQALSTLKLDKHKDKVMNINTLKGFVRLTTKQVIKHLKKHIATDLASLKTSLLLAVKQDLNINLDVELGNLEEDFKGRVCTVFVTCNGKVTGTRRSFDSGIQIPNSDSVYVKVRMSLNDDNIRETINKNKASGSRKLYYRKRRNNKNRYTEYSNINVTRTTIGVESTQKNIDSNLI